MTGENSPLDDSWHKGTDMLLRILGGLVLGYMVASAKRFLTFLQGGPEFGPWVWSAYGLYVLNVFRQIHGMAIVLTDKRYSREVGVPNLFENMISFIGMVFVLSVPCALVTYINITVPDVAPPTGVSSGYPCLWVLNAYLLTALAYLAWDAVTFRHLWGLQETQIAESAKGVIVYAVLSLAIGVLSYFFVSRKLGSAVGVGFATSVLTVVLVGLMIHKRVKTDGHRTDESYRMTFWRNVWQSLKWQNAYKYWVLNWMLLLFAEIVPGLLYLVLTVVPGLQTLSADGNAGSIIWKPIKNPHVYVPMAITVLAGFYTIADYAVNVRFYFSTSRYDADRLRSRTHASDSRLGPAADTSTPGVLAVIRGKCKLRFAAGAVAD
jgi:hypothetical protein